uniref:C2H2-type domain-containing protein n=1 Tax=Scleropages formosus TaxID=113540 RepID=A0A8C9UAT8_SCLFO
MYPAPPPDKLQISLAESRTIEVRLWGSLLPLLLVSGRGMKGSGKPKRLEDGQDQIGQRLSQAEFQHHAGGALGLSSTCSMRRDPWTVQDDSDTETDDPDFPYGTEQGLSDDLTAAEGSHVTMLPSRAVDVKPHFGMLSIVHHQVMREDLVHNSKHLQYQPVDSTPASKDKGECTLAGNHLKPSKKLKTLRKVSKGEKRFSCMQCGKSFTTRFYLKIHLRIHTGERPFSCAECGKTFYCTSHLISHQRSHTGEKPYSCDECGNSYSHLNSLKLHYKVHRQERLMDSTTCKSCYDAEMQLLWRGYNVQ